MGRGDARQGGTTLHCTSSRQQRDRHCMLHSQCGLSTWRDFSKSCTEDAYPKYPRALTHKLSLGVKFHPKPPSSWVLSSSL